MGSIHAQRIQQLRERMQAKGVDYYIIPTSDCHNSEYVCDFFKVREYLSGFTGSSGTLLVSREEALLWTDGRYFIQAAGELEGSGIRLMKMGEESVPTLTEYLGRHVQKDACIAFDGQVVSCKLGRRFEKAAGKKEARLICEEDLAAALWQDRPALPKGKLRILPDEFSGCNVEAKLDLVREKMKEHGAQVHLLTKLDDIMWLFNIRGEDIPCNPVALSYAILTDKEAYLFVQDEAMTDEAAQYFAQHQIIRKPYADFYETARELLKAYADGEKSRRVLLDENEIPFALYRMAEAYAEIVWESNPTLALKAVKNETELDHMRQVYIKDSVAVIRFIRHIKQQIKRQAAESDGKAEPALTETKAEPLTELYAARYMDDLRRGIDGFWELSFETISAYKENAAMMHYAVSEKSNKRLEAEGFLLVDSGGQYMGGTTDVTRTIALGRLTDEERRDFTLVAAGMLRLLYVRFLNGCTGRNLDIIARAPLWNIGRDYKCGTGHGVGYILNVHEGPHRIGFSYQKDTVEAKLVPGMVVSNEPGVYVEGSHGIRTENIMVCQKAEKTQDGQFLCFEPLTYVPIDLEAIDPAYLTKEDRELLNAYHRAVYEKTALCLDEDERLWLLEQTREI